MRPAARRRPDAGRPDLSDFLRGDNACPHPIPVPNSRPHPVLPGSPGSGLAYAIDRDAVMPDLQTLIGNAIQTIEATQPAPDAILGGFVRLTSLCRSVSFHEGKLLESALIRLAEANPDLVVLSQGLRLPLTKAAVEAVASNPVE